MALVPLDFGEQVKRFEWPACGDWTDNEFTHAADEGVMVARCKECSTVTGRKHRGSVDGEMP